MRFNDGKVTPQGTLLVGRMHAKWREGKRGRLYALDPGARWVRGGGVGGRVDGGTGVQGWRGGHRQALRTALL